MIKVLNPIHDRITYSDPVADDILQRLYDLIFAPVFNILGVKASSRINSMQDIKDALRAGRISWQEGWFYGEFNAVVGRALRELGAKFSSQKRAYKLDIGKIPMDLRTDIVIGKGMTKAKTDAVLKHLEEVEKTKIILGTGEKASATLDSLNEQAVKTFKVLPENIQIPLNITDRQKAELLGTYQKNVEEYAEDWKKEAIERLREKTSANAALGYRSDRLAKIVKTEFGVSQHKAKFIARQETARFVSKYREQRYIGAGVKQYIWSTSKDVRVRPDHAALDGKIFSWDNPPIVDTTTGKRANPGEDFSCRCLALPVIRLGVS